MTVYALVFQLFLPILFLSVICIDFSILFFFHFLVTCSCVLFNSQVLLQFSLPTYILISFFIFLMKYYFLEMELMTPWWEIVIWSKLNRVVVNEKFSSRLGTVVWLTARAGKTKEAKLWKTGAMSVRVIDSKNTEALE